MRPVEGFMTVDGLFFENPLHGEYHEAELDLNKAFLKFMEVINAPDEAKLETLKLFTEFCRFHQSTIFTFIYAIGKLQGYDELHRQSTKGGEGDDTRVRVGSDVEMDQATNAEDTSLNVEEEVGGEEAYDGKVGPTEAVEETL